MFKFSEKPKSLDIKDFESPIQLFQRVRPSTSSLTVKGSSTDIQIRPVIYIGNRTEIDPVPERNRNAIKDFSAV